MEATTPDIPESDDSQLAFDLLDADNTHGSGDGITPRLLHRRGLSRSFDEDSSYSVSGRDWGLLLRSGSASSNNGRDNGRRWVVRQPLLKSIYQELSQLAAEADGVSEKVKVCFVVSTSRCIRAYLPSPSEFVFVSNLGFVTAKSKASCNVFSIRFCRAFLRCCAAPCSVVTQAISAC